MAIVVLRLLLWMSHPSRGALIEIASVTSLAQLIFVAPLTGCVD